FALELGQSLVGLAGLLLRRRVGARPRLVERKPGDGVLVAGEPPVPEGAARGRRPGKRAKLEIARRQDGPGFSHLHRLDQHGAALPAANAFGGDALLDPEPLHRVDEMQHDAVAARSDRMAEPDRAAVDVELVARYAPERALEAEQLAAERLVLPGGEAGEHLRRERLVQFPQPDVAERQPMPAQD